MSEQQAYYDTSQFQGWVNPKRKAEEARKATQSPQTSSFDYLLDADIHRISELQTQFNRDLGIAANEQLAYNPVLARWKYEQCKTDTEKQQLRLYEGKQIDTAIRERWQTAESSYTYLIDEKGKLRNEFFPDEPFEQVLLRGVKVREKDNSQELERERSEVRGMLKIEALVNNPNTPIGKKVYLFSPPSTVKDSPYVHDFVDEFTVALDPKTKKRIVKATRFECDMTEEERRDIALTVNPNYFDSQTGKSDAWYLGHPITGDVMKSVRKKALAMKEELSKRLLPVLTPAKLHVLDAICAGTFNPLQIAQSWDALLAESSEVKRNAEKLFEQTTDANIVFSALEHTKKQFVTADARMDYYRKQNIEQIKAGCGTSSSFLKNAEGKVNSVLNSVSQFAAQEWFNCPKCEYKADGPIGNTCPGCGLTKEIFAQEEGAVVCD